MNGNGRSVRVPQWVAVILFAALVSGVVADRLSVSRELHRIDVRLARLEARLGVQEPTQGMKPDPFVPDATAGPESLPAGKP